jgi:hypothetical protein
VGEGLVVRIHRHLRHDGGHRDVAPALAEVVQEALLEHVAYLALAHGSAHVHRHGRDRLRGEGVLDEQVAHLGSVAVGQHHLPAVFHQLGDAAHRLVDVEQLFLEGADLPGLQDGVAAQSHHDPLSGLARRFRHVAPQASSVAACVESALPLARRWSHHTMRDRRSGSPPVMAQKTPFDMPRRTEEQGQGEDDTECAEVRGGPGATPARACTLISLSHERRHYLGRGLRGARHR